MHECERLCVSVRVWMQAFIETQTLLLSTERRNSSENSMQECDVAGRFCSYDTMHTAAYYCLMAGLTELTLADELSVQTHFQSFTQNTCTQQKEMRECLTC